MGLLLNFNVAFDYIGKPTLTGFWEIEERLERLFAIMIKMNRKIAPVVTKRKLGEPSGDVQYWRSRPYEERLEALEEIRQEYHQWKGDVQSGFQRVYRIIKR